MAEHLPGRAVRPRSPAHRPRRAKPSPVAALHALTPTTAPAAADRSTICMSLARASSASSRDASEISLIRVVQTTHVVLDDGEQPARAKNRCARSAVSDRAAQRGQRIFQFVRDIGREAGSRRSANRRARSCRARRRQMPRSVRAIGEIRNLLPRLAAAPDAFRRFRQSSDRFGYRSGGRTGKQQHHAGRDDEDANDGPALGRR